ncbi:uncharacterized protein LOC130269327 [Hyla sarda]|uniref:uncharacterized protein LOC130269327 n=1 Tax=Hyla sarda TaxID=327740 RepID=UPI0024C3EB62|nr:uncharacterized protein LOC130269327 [Hyla sarda]
MPYPPVPSRDAAIILLLCLLLNYLLNKLTGTATMPLLQRTPRNGKWVTVGSGRLRVVNRRHVPQSVGLHNSFAALSECKGNMDIGSSTEGEEPSTPMSNVCKTAAKEKKDKVKSERKQLLLGDSIIRSMELKENGFVRGLPSATARRDRRLILNIVKQAKQEGEVDVLVHLGTNVLACNKVSEIFYECMLLYPSQHLLLQLVNDFDRGMQNWIWMEKFMPHEGAKELIFQSNYTNRNLVRNCIFATQ